MAAPQGECGIDPVSEDGRGAGRVAPEQPFSGMSAETRVLDAEQADELGAWAALVGVAGAAAARLGRAGVPDLADQAAVQQQTQPDLALAVPQGVRDQLADQQLR
jgi:hypothetical protein